MQAIRTLLDKVFGNNWEFQSPIVRKTEVTENETETLKAELTLGELFLQREKLEETQKRQRYEAEQYRQALQYERDAIVVDQFLEAVKVSFIHDIKRGVRPESVLIPEGAPFNTQSWRFEKMLHRIEQPKFYNKESYDEFFKWVHEHKLYVGVFRRKDARYEVKCWAANPKV